MPLPPRRSFAAWKTRAWMRLLCGRMPEPSTAARGVAQWIASWRDTPASHSASPESNGGPTTPGISGPLSPASLARSLPPMSSARTSPATYRWDSTTSSRIFTDWATALRRDCVRRLKSALRTFALGSGSWPTPRVEDGESAGAHRKGPQTLNAKVRSLIPTPMQSDAMGAGSRNLPGSRAHAGVSLTDFVLFGNSRTPRLLPAPSASDYGTSHNGIKKSLPSGGTPSLSTMARWATPTVQDAHNNGNPSRARRESPGLNGEVGGKLNPTWVEWLMGWPIRWTDSAFSATDGAHWQARFRSQLCSLLSPTRTQLERETTGGLPLFDDA